MLDLKRRTPDVRRFVASLEEWIIRTLASFDVVGERRDDRIGVWVRRPDKGEGYEDKIAAIGIRVKQWVTLHGMALNVAPDLSHFSGIVPCGVNETRYGVTSLADLKVRASMTDVDAVLRREFDQAFRANGRSNGRQHGKIAASLREIDLGPFALIECAHARRKRAAPARLDRSLDLGSRASEHGLDRAVTAIAHPALQATLTRFILDKSAIAHALDTAADDDMADHAIAHAPSPASMTRAPVQRDADHRSTD